MATAGTKVSVTLKGIDAGMSQVLSKANRGLQEVGRSANSLTSKLKGSEGALAALGISATVTGAIMIGTFKRVVQQAGEFQQAMAFVGAITGTVGRQFGSMEEQARKLGETTSFTAVQAANGMRFLGQAGYDATQIIASLPAVLNLAEASAMDLATTADYVSNIMQGFGWSAERASQATDILAKTATRSNTSITQLAEAMKFVAPVSKSLGVSMQETAAAIGVMSDAGIQGSNAGTALRRIMLRLIDPPAEARKALAQLGVEVAKNADGNLDLAATMERLRNANITAAQASKLFGIYAVSAGLAVGEAIPKLRELTEENETSAGALNEMSKRIRNTYTMAVKRLTSAWEGLKESLGAPLLDAMQGVIDRIAKILNALSEWAKAHPTLVKWIVGLAGALSALVLVGGLVVGALAGIIAIIGPLGAAVGLLGGAVAALGAVLPILGALSPIILGIGAGLVAVVAYWEDLSYWIKQAYRDISNFLRPVAEIGKLLLSFTPLGLTLDALKEIAQYLGLIATEEEKREELLNEEVKKYREIQGEVDKLRTKQEALTSTEKSRLELLEKKAATMKDSLKGRSSEIALEAGKEIIEEARGFLDGYAQMLYDFGVYSSAKYRDIFGVDLPETVSKSLNAMTEQNRAAFEKMTKTTQNVVGNMKKELKALQASITEFSDASQKKLAGAEDSWRLFAQKVNPSVEDTQEAFSEYYEAVTEGVDDMVKHTNQKMSQFGVLIDEAMSNLDSSMSSADLQKFTDGFRDFTQQSIDNLRRLGENVDSQMGAIRLAIQNINKAMEDEEKRHMARMLSINEQADAQMLQLKKKAIDEDKSLTDTQKTEQKDELTFSSVLQKAAEAKLTAEEGGVENLERAKQLYSESMRQATQLSDTQLAMTATQQMRTNLLNVEKVLNKEKTEEMDKQKKEAEAQYTKLEALRQKLDQIVKTLQQKIDLQIEINQESLAKAKQQLADLRDQAKAALDLQSKAASGGTAKLAIGGRIPGYGGGDRVRALLERGEFVMRKEAVRKYGAGFFAAANALRMRTGGIVDSMKGAVQRFADGGMVMGVVDAQGIASVMTEGLVNAMERATQGQTTAYDAGASQADNERLSYALERIADQADVMGEPIKLDIVVHSDGTASVAGNSTGRLY